MAKEKGEKLTKFELEIMDLLWELGSASVREIQEKLPASRQPAYTTVQTIVYRLEEKGAVRRLKKIGNAHVFEPTINRKSVHRRLIEDLLDLLGTRPLIAHLIESGRLSLKDLQELEKTVAKAESDAKKGSGQKSKSDKGE